MTPDNLGRGHQKDLRRVSRRTIVGAPIASGVAALIARLVHQLSSQQDEGIPGLQRKLALFARAIETTGRKKSVIAFASSNPLSSEDDPQRAPLFSPIRSGIHGTSDCHLALTTGENLLAYPGGVKGLLNVFFQRAVGARPSERQTFALARLLEEFCSPKGFEIDRKLACFLYLCPVTLSAGYQQAELFGLKSKPPVPVGAVVRCDPGQPVHMCLTSSDRGPRVVLRPSEWEFAGVEPGPSVRPPFLRWSAYRRKPEGVAYGVDSEAIEFETFEEDISVDESLPSPFDGFTESVMNPIVVWGDSKGFRRRLGYTDLNLSCVKVRPMHLDAVFSFEMMRLAFRSTDHGLMQASTNYGEFSQYLQVTPGLQTALERALVGS